MPSKWKDPAFYTITGAYLGIFENKKIGLVIPLQELKVELDRLLASEDSSELVIYVFRLLCYAQRQFS